jgi:hypothetical protein
MARQLSVIVQKIVHFAACFRDAQYTVGAIHEMCKKGVVISPWRVVAKKNWLGNNNINTRVAGFHEKKVYQPLQFKELDAGD